MNGFVKFEVSRSDVVPEENRVAWLEKHGVVAKRFEIQAVAPLAVWARIAKIDDEGAVRWDWATTNWNSPASAADKRISAEIATRLRENPTDLSNFDVETILNEEADKLEAAERAKEEKEAAASAVEVALNAKIAALTADELLDADGVLTDRLPVNEALRTVICRNLSLHHYGRESRMAALNEEQDRRVEAAKARKIAELSAWVASNPAPFEANVVRAASEGRDVRGAVRRAIVARVEEVVDSLDNFGRPAAAYDFEADKRTPTSEAYAIRDAIVGVTGEILEAVALPDATITVSDFGRINVSKEDKKVWRSAIRLEIEHPWISPIEMHVLTEPLNYEEAEEEDY